MVYRGDRIMGWGNVIGAGVSLIGGAMSRKSSKKSQSKADDMSQKELDFQQARVDDWKAVYGDLQDNLSEYYNNLDSDAYITQGLESIEIEKERSQEMMSQNFAQRGISDSGIAVRSDMNLEMDTMQQRADVRRSADSAVADEKMRFLQVGLGQDPGESMSKTLADRAAEARGRADTAARSSAAATQSALTATGTALEAYLNRDKG